MRAAMQQGPLHLAQDLSLIFGDWGVPLEEVKQPVSIWQGECDATAAPVLANALVVRLPRCDFHLVPGAGHLSVWIAHAEQVLGKL